MYPQIVGIPMVTNSAPFFCYERDFMLSLFDNNQAGRALGRSSPK